MNIYWKTLLGFVSHDSLQDVCSFTGRVACRPSAEDHPLLTNPSSLMWSFRSKKRKMFYFVKIGSPGLQLFLSRLHHPRWLEAGVRRGSSSPTCCCRLQIKTLLLWIWAALSSERGSETGFTPPPPHETRTWKNPEVLGRRSARFYRPTWTRVTVRWKLDVFYGGGGDVQLLTALHLLTGFMDLEQRAPPELRGFLIKHSGAGL